MRRSFLAVALLTGVASPALAQADSGQTGESEEAGFELGRIIVRGTPQQAPLIESSFMGQEAIEVFNRNTLDDAAALIPGVTASNSGGSRNERLLFVRGFNRFQVPLSIDGIRVYLPADNRLDYGRFLTADLAEIQVAKGYASVLDGPGAMGGAVNLVTRKPTRELEAEARGNLQLDRDGDYAGYTGFALLGTRQENWYGQASYARNVQDHWDLPDGFVPTASEDGGERDLSRNEDWRFNAKIGFTPNATDEYSLSYTRQEGSKNAPLSTVDPVNIQRNWTWPFWNLDSIYFLSRTALTPDLTLRTRAYRNSFNNLLRAFDDTTQTTQTRPRAFDSFYEDEAWGGSAELSWALWGTHTLAAALQYRSDEHVEFQQSFAPAPFLEPPQVNREDTWSIAGEYSGALSPVLTATLGVSYDWRDLKQAEEWGTPPGGGAAAIFSYPIRDADAFNAQGRLEWQVAPDASLYGSISSRARFPTIFERFSSRFGGAVSNPDLKAERATNFELGGEYGSGALSLSGAMFYSRLDDVIVAFPFIFQGQAVSQSRNLGQGENFGLELSANMHLSADFGIGGNYTWTEQELDDPSDAAFRPTGVPTHAAFLWAAWSPDERLTVTPSLELASDRWTVSTDGTRYFRTGSYADASLRIDYQLTEGVQLGAGVRNAFDSLYQLTDGFPEAGRRFFVVLNLKP
ncbi:MAG: TonB-dependent receptor [Betaproteobacteria bacterium]|nr:TonB-dependent receptor [Betaproteobacteria bacterium]